MQRSSFTTWGVSAALGRQNTLNVVSVSVSGSSSRRRISPATKTFGFEVPALSLRIPVDQFLHVLLRCRVRLAEESSRGRDGDERVGEQQIDQAHDGARPSRRTDPPLILPPRVEQPSRAGSGVAGLFP
jgi:hypothetical protein